MITILDTIGPAVWRASWQATALALVVMLLVSLLGERISPRWRYRLWSLAVIRLLILVVPASPWSAFNLVRLIPDATAPRLVDQPAGPIIVAVRQAQPESGEPKREGPPLRNFESETNSPALLVPATPASPSTPAAVTSESTTTFHFPAQAFPIVRIVALIWVAGCLLLGLKLMRSSIVLRRRLSVCRLVTDAGVLSALELAQKQIGVRVRARLLVTPESISPCIVGVLKPRIIVPEALFTDSSTDTLRHVLAHELAHLVRGDLWTNWLLLVAHTIHWFNPVVWWTIREMQNAREAACDDLALAALGGDRSVGVCLHDRRARGEPGSLGHRTGHDRPLFLDSPLDKSHQASGAVFLGHCSKYPGRGRHHRGDCVPGPD